MKGGFYLPFFLGVFMALKDIINEELKAAMKSGDKVKLETIRSIRALILEYEKSGKKGDMTPEDELQLLTGAAKKRKESIEQFRNAGREELALKEEAELSIIQSFLPKQANDNEILSIIKRIAGEIGAAEKAHFPKLMPLVIKELKGQADGQKIKELVETFLS